MPFLKYIDFKLQHWIILSLLFKSIVSGAQTNDPIESLRGSIAFFETYIQHLRETNSDSAEFELANYDTVAWISKLNEQGLREGNQINYEASYNAYWRALSLATAIEDHGLKSRSNLGLGILYSLFNRNAEAEKFYQKSIFEAKKAILSEQADSLSLRDAYYNLSVHYRYTDKLKLATQYLDSCLLINVQSIYSGTLVRAEHIYLKIARNDYTDVQSEMNELKEQLDELNIPSYWVIFYANLAEFYLKSNEVDAALNAYAKAIMFAKETLSHLNFVPRIYLRLSELFNELGRYNEALEFMTSTYRLENELYSARSENNSFLLEIKDQFREEIEKKEKEAVRFRLQQLETDEQILLLQRLLLIIALGFVFFAATIWFRRIRRNQKLAREMHESQLQKNQEILGIRNRELTNSTLQLIAKDELLNDIEVNLKKLQKPVPNPEIKKLISNIKINKDLTWLEFENRFTAANEGFINRLREKFPNLKSYDIKIAALLKLKFSGKEMSRLLGISAESANTARYRLRKKLNLEKEVDLVGFIDSI